MICGGGGWACRTAVIEFAMALVCAAMSDRIAWNSSERRVGIPAIAISMRSARPSKRLSWNPRKLKPPIMTTATMPITHRAPSIDVFNPVRAPSSCASRVSTVARQPTSTSGGRVGGPLPPRAIVVSAAPLASMRSSWWRSMSMSILLTVLFHELQECLNLFQTFVPGLVRGLDMI